MATKKVFIVGGDGFARECYNNLIIWQRSRFFVDFAAFKDEQ